MLAHAIHLSVSNTDYLYRAFEDGLVKRLQAARTVIACNDVVWNLVSVSMR